MADTANVQKFKMKTGKTANQLMKAIAVADSYLAKWFTVHWLRSLPIRTMTPADAHAEANVRVNMICIQKNKF